MEDMLINRRIKMAALYLFILVAGCMMIARHDKQAENKGKQSVINERIKRKIAKSHKIDVRV